MLFYKTILHHTLTHACARRIMPPKTIRTKASASTPTGPPIPQTPEKTPGGDAEEDTPRDVNESESESEDDVISQSVPSEFVAEVDAMLSNVTQEGDAMAKLDIMKKQIRAHELRLAAKSQMNVLNESMYEDLNTRICAFVCSLITHGKNPTEIEALCLVCICMALRARMGAIAWCIYTHTCMCVFRTKMLSSRKSNTSPKTKTS